MFRLFYFHKCSIKDIWDCSVENRVENSLFDFSSELLIFKDRCELIAHCHSSVISD